MSVPACPVPAAGSRRSPLLSSVTGVLAALLATPVVAQQTAPAQQAPTETPATAPAESAPPIAPVDASNATASTAPGDIVVTAQKRAERLRDVPIAISVVTNQLLASTNSRNFAELQGTIPSVYFAGNSGGGRTYITLRGATGLALNTGDEPVAIYMDDVYLARGVTIGMSDLLDVGAIEIVRGPQGTLQGRNATAGAILLRSADPTSTFEGRVTAGLSDPLEFRAQAALSGPLGGGLKGRIAVGYVNDRGWAYNPYNGQHIGGAKSYQARAVLTYGDTGPFDARVVFDYAHVRNFPAIFRYAATTFSTTPGALVKTPTPNTPLPDATYDAIFNHNRISLNPGSNTLVETGGVSAKLSYAFGPVDLVSVTGFRIAHVDGINDSDGLDVSKQGYNHNNDKSNEVSQELRLQSSGKHFLNYILGAYYFYEHQPYTDDIYNLQFSIPTNTVTRYSGVQNTVSYAFFGDATVDLTRNFQVIGGIRYTHDHKSLNAVIQPTNLDTNVTITTPYLDPVTKTPPGVTYTDVSYRAKLVWHPTPDIMIYGGYGRGFRSGGYNPFLLQGPYSPEILKSWEVGSKGDFFDRALSYSLSAYTNDYSNLQLRGGVPSGGAIITNAGRSRIKGVELEFTARPAQGLRLTANGSYTDAKFTSFPLAFDSLNHPVDATGNKLPRTPAFQYFVAGEKDLALSSDWVLTAEANWRWRGRIYFLFTNQQDPTWSDKPGGELGLRLTAHSADSRVSGSIFATNVTNERIINTAAVTFSYPQVGLNKPRVIGASAEYRF